MNKKRIIAISVGFVGLLLIIIGLFWICLFPKERKKIENESKSEIPINDSTRFFTCTKDSSDVEAYQLDFKYDFYFTDNELKSGTLYYIFSFHDKETFDSFMLDLSEMNTTVEEDKDDDNLKRTYSIYFRFPNEGKTIDSYIEYLKGLQYNCSETK